MEKRVFWAVALWLLWPAYVFAAQFAPSALFLSQEAVTEGETVLIHAVMQNNSAIKFAGNLVIRDNEGEVGKVAVTLAPNEVRAASVSWKPAAGSQKITAELVDSDGAVAQSESATFSIKAKPKPAATSTSASAQVSSDIETSQSIQDKIGSVSPGVESAVAPVFKMVDGARSAVAGVLDGQISSVKPKLTPVPGVVAGTSTINAPDQGNWFWSIIYTVYFYILTVLRFLVGSAAAFYPIVAIAFFFILWRTFKRFRR